ncbi:MAG TPA: NACHT domain-containing protein, partial [Bacteroidetes bacterium]|nr:NACHT domain-containing protein [Bacteroidota bacterium]
MTSLLALKTFLGKQIGSKILSGVLDTAAKNNFIIQTLSDFGLVKPKPKQDFESIYAHALIEFFVEAEPDSRDFHVLFADKKVQTAFQGGLNSDDIEQMYAEIQGRSKEKYADLVAAHPNSADLLHALELFADIYDFINLKTASPFQIKKYYEDLAFQKATLEKQKKSLEKQEESLEKLKKATALIQGLKADNAKKSFDSQIQKYLRQLRQEFNDKYLAPTDKYVPLIGHQVQEVMLSKMDTQELQEQDLALMRAEGKQIHFGQNKLEKETFQPIEQYFQLVLNEEKPERYQFIVLLGEYGTGKTTFFRFLAHALATDYLEISEACAVHDPRKRIPILLSLRDYNGEKMEQFIVSHFNQNGVKDINQPELKNRLRNGEFILLLDGFDEMISREAETKKKYHADLLKDLVPEKRDAGSLVFLSSREEYFKGEAERDEVFGLKNSEERVNVEFLHLDTFTDEQVQEFL